MPPVLPLGQIRHVAQHPAASAVGGPCGYGFGPAGCDMGFAVRVPEVRAGGLLHDIAKTYSVKYGGSHAQIGAAWTVAETGNYAIARVPMHAPRPWALPQGQIFVPCLFVIYADKRIRHDSCVTLLKSGTTTCLSVMGAPDPSARVLAWPTSRGKNIESALEAQC